MNYAADASRYQSMKYNRVGKSGLKLPSVSLGFWHNFGSKDNFENIKKMCLTAFDHGITHFDLANNYGPAPGSAEENLGRILRDELHGYRDELVISTKAGWGMFDGPYGDGGCRKYLLSSLDSSLRRLGVDYVDIYYHHRPDPETPIEESLYALSSAVQSGKALYVGVSNYDREQTEFAVRFFQENHTPFIINQTAYSIFDRHVEENGLKHFAAENGVGFIAFCPLNQGLLTDRYLKGIPEDSRAIKNGHFLKPSDLTEGKLAQIRALHALAQNRGQKLSQMALSWVLRDGEVTSAIIGASRPEQILENIQINDAKPFTADELAEIDRICAMPVD